MRTLNSWAAACAVAFSVATAPAVLAQTGQTGTMGQTGGTAQTGGEMAGTTSQPDTPVRRPNSRDDLQKFVERAAINNMAEIQLGQLAVEKAQDPEVKQFAQTMVDEHNKAQDELSRAASAAGISVPSSLDQKHQKIHDKLSNLSGSDFDREFMKVQVKAHDDTRKLLEKRAGKQNASPSYGAGSAAGTSGTAGGSTTGTSGTSGTASGTAAGTSVSTSGANEIDGWAASMLPSVQQHLQTARDIEKRLKESRKNSGDKYDKKQ